MRALALALPNGAGDGRTVLTWQLGGREAHPPEEEAARALHHCQGVRNVLRRRPARCRRAADSLYQCTCERGAGGVARFASPQLLVRQGEALTGARLYAEQQTRLTRGEGQRIEYDLFECRFARRTVRNYPRIGELAPNVLFR